MRKLLRKIILWALGANEPKHDPSELDRIASSADQ